jgi:hypothetical protein
VKGSSLAEGRREEAVIMVVVRIGSGDFAERDLSRGIRDVRQVGRRHARHTVPGDVEDLPVLGAVDVPVNLGVADRTHERREEEEDRGRGGASKALRASERSQ